MPNTVANIVIPDSQLATQAAELLRDHGDELLWNHSNRVFLFGAIQGQQVGLKFDAELLYISALFHDLGLTKKFSSPDKRFEVDGANAARDFLRSQGVPQESIRLVWDAIAFHTTIGIAQYKEPEVALIYSGVGYDVMGENFEALSAEVREQVIAAFPRNNFKQKILHAFLEGFKHKPETTFGNIKSDVCELLLPGYKRPSFCDCVLHNHWDE
ncbi:HD domain-containing protein [Paenibacillus sacheonensis]|uniref:HD domain-containing protein n=1 Tax=Paenibacillus sacheonensis TaxID=742054 RepID=A0A7X4YWE0_9BACL|nr:HD domain-containing protein [Paenibacillus sacheonensis]MBM7569015.1 HD superfamily phosphodiesterase [Paenibacillus sacheonensis]NBC72804.1 HD domain-containing protein [Paenibacillus sacheonensis]